MQKVIICNFELNAKINKVDVSTSKSECTPVVTYVNNLM